MGEKNRPVACDGRALKANFEDLHAQDSAFAFQSQHEPQADDPRAKMTGGRRSREKGNRTERALVRFFQDHGFAAERVPLSGGAGGSYRGDLTVPLLGVDRVVEVKARAGGFRELYRWLDGRDLLVVKADRRSPLVIVPLALAAKIARAAEAAKGGGQ
ncbi:MAG: hypothetical protein P4L80_02485 [Xanthobacteraceae bacterium]|nr:hypothetical protein [Xanthobacteraceae bacterium]